MRSLTVFCNAYLAPAQYQRLTSGLAGHRLVRPEIPATSNLHAGGPEAACRDADIAFGQPDPTDIVAGVRLKLIALTSAGYARYDTAEIRNALQPRGGVICSASMVYADACAHHALQFMLSDCRQNVAAVLDQAGKRTWPKDALRDRCRLLTNSRVLIVGYGTIGARLTELLRPFHAHIVALRRKPRGDEGVPTLPLAELHAQLGKADHVVNLMPGVPETAGMFAASEFAAMRPGTVLYNIGRGTTVDQPALEAALRTGHLRAAYLDVTDPEPLRPAHPLWDAPNCHITPHTAGGYDGEFDRQVDHFLENFHRFMEGKPLADKVIG